MMLARKSMQFPNAQKRNVTFPCKQNICSNLQVTVSLIVAMSSYRNVVSSESPNNLIFS